LWVIGRNPDYWDRPFDFYPERFFEKLKKPNAFMPFHWGNRLCLGQNMAYNEARVMAAMILQNFNFDLVPGQNITYPVLTEVVNWSQLSLVGVMEIVLEFV
jgi:cytochrome P450